MIATALALTVAAVLVFAALQARRCPRCGARMKPGTSGSVWTDRAYTWRYYRCPNCEHRTKVVCR